MPSSSRRPSASLGAPALSDGGPRGRDDDRGREEGALRWRDRSFVAGRSEYTLSECRPSNKEEDIAGAGEQVSCRRVCERRRRRRLNEIEAPLSYDIKTRRAILVSNAKLFQFSPLWPLVGRIPGSEQDTRYSKLTTVLSIILAQSYILQDKPLLHTLFNSLRHLTPFPYNPMISLDKYIGVNSRTKRCPKKRQDRKNSFQRWMWRVKSSNI
jgi:hypothetical protein